jgi:hypothetical protein
MGLIIDWTYNGKQIKAYLKLISIGVERGWNGVAPSMRRGGGSFTNQVSEDFMTTIHYVIYDKKGGERISEGIFKSLYDLDSKQNVLAEVYKYLKEKHDDCKTAIDEV